MGGADMMNKSKSKPRSDHGMTSGPRAAQASSVLPPPPMDNTLNLALLLRAAVPILNDISGWIDNSRLLNLSLQRYYGGYRFDPNGLAIPLRMTASRLS
jgi:hypothetical protein